MAVECKLKVHRAVLQKVGFFHFGADHSTPVQALKCALKDASDVKGALIVLPEAFNISVYYYSNTGDRNFDPSVLDKVADLAKEFGVAFVAGLIIQECCGPQPPCSGAYLIESTQQTLMCYKVIPDDSTKGTSFQNYTPCQGTSDFNNPIDYEGIRIGALICADANPPKIPLQCMLEYTNSMYKRVNSVVKACNVMCVPAHMAKNSFTTGEVGDNTDVPKTLILANSRTNGLPSFITDPNGIIVKRAVCCSGNEIVALRLDDLSRA